MDDDVVTTELARLRRARVTRIFIEPGRAGIWLQQDGEGDHVYEWTIAKEFDLVLAGNIMRLKPREPSSMGALTGLIGQQLASIDRSNASLTRFVLSGGGELRCPSDERYESWQVAGPNGYLAVCIPGGEMAIWCAEVT
jgi:hypothetical protein